MALHFADSSKIVKKRVARKQKLVWSLSGLYAKFIKLYYWLITIIPTYYRYRVFFESYKAYKYHISSTLTDYGIFIGYFG